MNQIEVIGQGRYSVAGEYLVALQEFALSRGVAPHKLLEGTGLPLDVLIQPHIRIGGDSMSCVIRNMISMSPNFAWAIEHGLTLPANAHGILGVAVQSAKNIAESIDMLTRYIDTRADLDTYSLIKKDDRSNIRITRGPISTNDEIAAFVHLFVFVNCYALARYFTGIENVEGGVEICLPIKEPIGFPHNILPEDLQVSFESEYTELSFPNAYTNKKLLPANEALLQAAKKQCEDVILRLHGSSDIVYLVRKTIRETEGILPTQDEIAVQLNMSPSTLKRRLRGANTSYQKLKDSERFNKALDLLKNSRQSIESIAEELGFSHASNFSKAFKVWAGCLPGEYREKQE